MIQDQVKLPVGVAFEVVMQGIRIRLGRSVVTICGVVCGIAFLMSILTGQIIKSGVAKEDAARVEVKRIWNFIQSDVGLLRDKTITVIVAGKLRDIDRRMLNKLYDEGAEAIVVPDSIQMNGLNGLAARQIITKKPANRICEGAAALLLMGDGEVGDIDWKKVMMPLKHKIIATMIPDFKLDNAADASLIQLSRKLNQDEIKEMEAEKKKSTFRSVWIITISLLVTIIGISNAMLMSVTERFREIGTMKCLGALSAFIRQIFIIESSLMGFVGGLLGSIIGAFFSIIAYSMTYGTALVFVSLNFGLLLLFGLACVVTGVVLSLFAALYPARVASNMVPATALRSNV